MKLKTSEIPNGWVRKPITVVKPDIIVNNKEMLYIHIDVVLYKNTGEIKPVDVGPDLDTMGKNRWNPVDECWDIIEKTWDYWELKGLLTKQGEEEWKRNGQELETKNK